MSKSESDQWFVRDAHEVQPISKQRLKAMAAVGLIGDRNQIRQVCDEAWIVAGTYEKLFRKQWYCQIWGDTIGPMQPRRLRQLITSNEIQPDTLMRHASSKKWILASDVPMLFDAPVAPRPDETIPKKRKISWSNWLTYAAFACSAICFVVVIGGLAKREFGSAFVGMNCLAIFLTMGARKNTFAAFFFLCMFASSALTSITYATVPQPDEPKGYRRFDVDYRSGEGWSETEIVWRKPEKARDKAFRLLLLFDHPANFFFVTAAFCGLVGSMGYHPDFGKEFLGRKPVK